MGRAVKRTRSVAYRTNLKEEMDEGRVYRPKSGSKWKQHKDWKSNGVSVSDHAVVRYLEYVYGFNMELVRKEMMADGRADVVRQHLNGKFPCGNGVRLVARNGVIVTVVKPRKQYDRGQT